MEDDLTIGARLYADKLLWFCERTDHRFELTGVVRTPRLFVDGPLDPTYLSDFQEAREGVVESRFGDGQKVSFDLAGNLHSGSYVLSLSQLRRLKQGGLVADGFVGQLETVATGTLLATFPVLKPGWAWRDVLMLEHAHPSFLASRHRTAP